MTETMTYDYKADTLHFVGKTYSLGLTGPIADADKTMVAIADAAYELDSINRRIASCLAALQSDIANCIERHDVGMTFGFSNSVLGSRPDDLDRLVAEQRATAKQISLLIHVSGLTPNA